MFPSSSVDLSSLPITVLKESGYGFHAAQTPAWWLPRRLLGLAWNPMTSLDGCEDESRLGSRCSLSTYCMLCTSVTRTKTPPILSAQPMELLVFINILKGWARSFLRFILTLKCYDSEGNFSCLSCHSSNKSASSLKTGTGHLFLLFPPIQFCPAPAPFQLSYPIVAHNCLPSPTPPLPVQPGAQPLDHQCCWENLRPRNTPL